MRALFRRPGRGTFVVARKPLASLRTVAHVVCDIVLLCVFAKIPFAVGILTAAWLLAVVLDPPAGELVCVGDAIAFTRAALTLGKDVLQIKPVSNFVRQRGAFSLGASSPGNSGKGVNDNGTSVDLVIGVEEIAGKSAVPHGTSAIGTVYLSDGFHHPDVDLVVATVPILGLDSLRVGEVVLILFVLVVGETLPLLANVVVDARNVERDVESLKGLVCPFNLPIQSVDIHHGGSAVVGGEDGKMHGDLERRGNADGARDQRRPLGGVF